MLQFYKNNENLLIICKRGKPIMYYYLIFDNKVIHSAFYDLFIHNTIDFNDFFMSHFAHEIMKT